MDSDFRDISFKQLTDFFRSIGADAIQHTDKGYLAHAIGVYNDLKRWGCDEELSRVGLFHSIYGTQIFQGFTLPLERRDEIRTLIGDRAERLSYANCAMERESFDAQVQTASGTGPVQIQDRLTHGIIELTEDEFRDLCTVHLCDWLEQVARWVNFDYRRGSYRALAERLGGIGLSEYDRVFAQEQTVEAT
jgi:hypothetical protein